MPSCPYDGEPLRYTPEGLEEPCDICEAELAHHQRMCRSCRMAPNMPDVINLKALLEALR